MALAGSIGALVACSAILGIERATLADAGSEAGVPGDSASDPCAAYCAVVNANCNGPNQEYLSTDPVSKIDVCMTMCPYIAHPQGDIYPFPGPDPPKTDTLGCRLWHAEKAGMEHPEVHCRHAGPLGAEACGSDPCVVFCNLDLSYCAEHSNVPVYNGDPRVCQTICSGDAGFPYFGRDSGDLIDNGGKMIERGNTLNCRLWHMETAIQVNDPQTHCPHTDQGGGGKCVSP
jgi:hypothetical protein